MGKYNGNPIPNQRSNSNPGKQPAPPAFLAPEVIAAQRRSDQSAGGGNDKGGNGKGGNGSSISKGDPGCLVVLLVSGASLSAIGSFAYLALSTMI